MFMLLFSASVCELVTLYLFDINGLKFVKREKGYSLAIPHYNCFFSFNLMHYVCVVEFTPMRIIYRIYVTLLAYKGDTRRLVNVQFIHENVNILKEGCDTS